MTSGPPSRDDYVRTDLSDPSVRSRMSIVADLLRRGTTLTARRSHDGHAVFSRAGTRPSPAPVDAAYDLQAAALASGSAQSHDVPHIRQAIKTADLSDQRLATLGP